MSTHRPGRPYPSCGIETLICYGQLGIKDMWVLPPARSSTASLHDVRDYWEDVSLIFFLPHLTRYSKVGPQYRAGLCDRAARPVRV